MIVFAAPPHPQSFSLLHFPQNRPNTKLDKIILPSKVPLPTFSPFLQLVVSIRLGIFA